MSNAKSGEKGTIGGIAIINWTCRCLRPLIVGLKLTIDDGSDSWRCDDAQSDYPIDKVNFMVSSQVAYHLSEF